MRHFYFILLGVLALLQAYSATAQVIAYPVCDSGISCMIAEIQVEGNTKTQTALIIREMSIRAGDSLSSDQFQSVLQLNYQRLFNLNLFTTIQISAELLPGQSDALLIKVKVKEQWFLLPQADLQLADRNINVWWNEQNRDLSRINLGVYLMNKNLTGRMDQLRTSAHIGYTQQLTATYIRPYLDAKKQQGMSLAAGYSRSREIAYTTADNKLLFTRHNNNFLYRYGFVQAAWYYRPAYHARHIVGLGYHHYQVGDTVVQLRPDFFQKGGTQLAYAELNYRYEYNGVDNWNYPRQGNKIVATAAARWAFLGADPQLVMGLEYGNFQRLGNRFLSSFVLRARNNLTNDPSYFMQSAMGYRTNYVRGYEYYVIEANRFAIGRLSLKYEALRRGFDHLPFRYLPKLPLWLYPKVFVDAGYASNNTAEASNTLANRWLYAVGFGFDLITAYDLKLRVEFAYNHLGENGLYLHANSE